MRQAVLRVEDLPRDALDAAATFHRDWLSQARQALRDSDALALLFAPSPYDHRGWRLAVVQDLAREVAPKRVNAVAGQDEHALAKTVDWLAQAPGITGQLLAVE